MKTVQNEGGIFFVLYLLSLSINVDIIFRFRLFTMGNSGVSFPSNSHFDEFIFPIVGYHRDDRDIRDAREE